MRLENKVAIITGGGTGIGRAIAEEFAGEGAHLVLVGKRKESLEDVCKALGQATYVQADVADPAAKDAVTMALDRYGRLDVLVNNAGTFGTLKPIEESTQEEWLYTFRVNVFGPVAMIAYAVAHIEGGSIINIASILGVIGAPNASAYSASKATWIGLTRQQAIELAPRGIRVNSISPTMTQGTEMGDAILQDEGLRDYLLAQHPLGRFAGPKDIAKLAVYLGSDESKYVTGQNFVVDGGRAAQ